MPSQFPPIILRKLDRLKRSIRFYAAIDGIAVLVLAVILLAVLDFALDRFFEFPVVLRAVILPVMTGIIGYVLWEWIVHRCFTAIRPDQLAGVLEHYVPNLNESLLTALEWGNDSEADPELIQQTINEAAAALRGVNVRRFFRLGRLSARFLFCLFCIALVAAGSNYHSESASLWFSRNILLSDKEYPRRSELLVDGFDKNGRVRIGRGDSFTLSIRANEGKPLVPESIRVRIGTWETSYRYIKIDQFRRETIEGTTWRIFTTTFPEMLETVNLQIRGGDTTLGGLCIEVVPTPTLTELAVKQSFPDYMRRQERTVALSGRTNIPDGTAITITAKSTKPLQAATVIIKQPETSLPGMDAEWTVRPLADGSFGSFSDTMTLSREETIAKELLQEFRVSKDSIVLTLSPLRQETTIDFKLLDTDLLTNRHSIRAELGIIKDQPPVVTARLEGIGPAITPEAVLPIVGEITDDNGLASAVCQYETEPAETTGEGAEAPQRQPTEGTTPITGIASGQILFPLEQSFAVLPLSVQPGDKLILSVEATDLYDLDSSPGQVGTGPRWLLEIVTPERLKSLLETREIALRQRFEIVIGEVERTKTILNDYSLEATDQQVKDAAALTLENEANATEERQQELQRNLESRRQKILQTVGADQSETGRYHVSRMLRDTQKEVYDLMNIVESFRTIRQEMINNRIFSEDERRRIDLEIMQPIRELIGSDFPEIDVMLGMLNQMLLERTELKRPEALAERQKILEQFDKTILKMIAIRDKMASMESFSEVIELLRSILEQQRRLRDETIEERRKQLLELRN